MSVEQLSAELQKKTRQIDMLDSTIMKMKNEMDATKKQLADLRKDNNTKNTRCAELESSNERMAKEIRNREQTMKVLTDQVATLKSSGRGSPQVRSPSLNQSIGSTLSNRSTVSSPTAVSAETENLRNEVFQLQAEVERLRNASTQPRGGRGFGTTTFGGSAAMDVNRIRALNDEVTTWKTRSENLMAELKVAQRKLAATDAEMARSNERAARAGEAQAKMESQLRSSQAEVSQLRELAQQSTRELQMQLKRYEGDASRLAADADKVSTQSVYMQRRIDALLTEKTSLETTASEALAAATKARDAARMAQAQQEEMSKEMEMKSVQMAQLYAELERVRLGKAASDAQFEQLTNKLTSAHMESANQQAFAKDMAGLAGNASEHAMELERQVNAMRERADAAELAIEALRSQLALSQADAGAKAEAQRATNDALEHANSTLDTMRMERKEMNSVKGALEDAQSRLELRVKELEADLGLREATVAEMTDLIDTMRADLVAKSNALAVAQAQADHTENALGTTKSKAAAEMSETQAFMNQQSDELEALVLAKEAAEQAQRDADESADNARRALIKTSTELAAVLQDLEETRAEANAEGERSEALSLLLSEREAELSSLRQQLGKAEATALQAESLIEQTQADMKRLEDANELDAARMAEISDLKDELAAKQKALDTANGTIKELERKIEDLREELSTASERNARMQSNFEDAEDRISQYEQERGAAAISVQDARSIQREFELRVADAKRAEKEAVEELDRANAEIAELKEQLAVAETTIGSLQDDLDEYKQEAIAEADWRARAGELEAELEEKLVELEQTQAAAVAAKERVNVLTEMHVAGAAAGAAVGAAAVGADGPTTPEVDVEEEESEFLAPYPAPEQALPEFEQEAEEEAEFGAPAPEAYGQYDDPEEASDEPIEVHAAVYDDEEEEDEHAGAAEVAATENVPAHKISVDDDEDSL